MWKERWNELEARFQELEEKNVLTDEEYEEIQTIYYELCEYNQY